MRVDKPDKPKGGRPPRDIDYDKVQNFAMQQRTDYEIAAMIGFSEDGFRKRKRTDDKLVEAIKRGRAIGTGSVRAIQFKRAMDGSDTAAIWFGKNYMGQSDKQQVDTNQPINVEIIIPNRTGDDEQ